MTSAQNPAPHTAASSHNGLRFSTWGLLVLLTTVSLVLALYLGVGRAFGLDTVKILRAVATWLWNELLAGLAWTAAFALAWNSRRLHPTARRLVLIGFGGMVLIVLTSALIDMVVFEAFKGSSWTEIQAWMVPLRIVAMALRSICWVLIVIAMFFGRNDPSAVARTDGGG